MRVVLDTNVLLSALLSPTSPPAQILSLWRSRKLDLLTAGEQLAELARATRYPRIRARLHPSVAGRLINRLRDLAIVVDRLPRIDRTSDPDDNYLLAMAEAGEAQFLITGDKPLLGLKRHKATRIVTPVTLVELLKLRGSQ